MCVHIVIMSKGFFYLLFGRRYFETIFVFFNVKFMMDFTGRIAPRIPIRCHDRSRSQQKCSSIGSIARPLTRCLRHNT